eukprot:sb/3471926/
MGYTGSGEGKWEGLRNVATTAFHSATKLQDVIDSWNINTSRWCGKHIYKRCKFLNSKSLSQLVTMLYLSLWHGLHLGYLTTFLQEFGYMLVERGMYKNTALQHISTHIPRPVGVAIGWLYTKVFLSFALVGFELYHYDTIVYVYNQVYWICPVLAVLVAVWNVVDAAGKRKSKEI